MVGAIFPARFRHSAAPRQPFSAMRSNRRSPTVGAAAAGRGHEKAGAKLRFSATITTRGAQLRDAVVRCVKEFPPDLVILAAQAQLNAAAVIVKGGREHAPDIFEHDGVRLDNLRDFDAAREQVALVFFSKLFAGDGKRRAGQAAGQQVDAPVEREVELFKQIMLEHRPFRAVQTERVTCVPVILKQGGMGKAGLFQPQRLAARARAKFQCRQHDAAPIPKFPHTNDCRRKTQRTISEQIAQSTQKRKKGSKRERAGGPASARL